MSDFCIDDLMNYKKPVSLYLVTPPSDLLRLAPIFRLFFEMMVKHHAKKIGTYETSILPYEDCCTIFTPKNPVTKPRVDKCEKYEGKWDFDKMVQDCIDNTEDIWVHPVKVEEDLF